MMQQLSPADRAKLAKLLGLLGSDYPGERDSAGIAAHRLVTARGLNWSTVLGPQAHPDFAPRRQADGWRQTVAACQRQRGSLRNWEVQFLDSLVGFTRLSRKQRGILDEIAGRVVVAGDK